LHKSLLTAFELAVGGRVIVLSPTYSDVMCDLDGSGLRTFPEALAAALHGCEYTERQGWHVFQWLQPGE
jgi:hypothetical protein